MCADKKTEDLFDKIRKKRKIQMANYVEMWKELGMDLEAHDALCAVLPSAFGDVYLSQENRPEGMAFWDMVVADIHVIGHFVIL